MSFIRQTVISLILVAVITGCDNPNSNNENTNTTSSDLVSFQSAKSKWQSQSVQFYTIESRRSCECLPEMSAQMEVSVSDDIVLSAFDVDSNEVISTAIQDEIKTVDGLFDLIEKAITDGVSIEVTYNEEYGYPETSKIDLEQLAVDGGLYVNLSNLDIKDSILALDNVTWFLESFHSIAGPQPIIENTAISLSIDMDNMRLTGLGGCNTYSADFVLDSENNTLTISNFFWSEMVCTTPENIMQQEQSYFATLAKIQFFIFDKATLDMVLGADAGLHFVVDQNPDEGLLSDNLSNDLMSLQIAKTKWHNLAAQFYTIQSQRICMCLPEMSALMEISVLADSVLSAFNIESGEAISAQIQTEIQTVDSLFALIEEAITNNITIEVSYHEEYGYPETTKIDLEQLAVDGGLYINLSNLELQDSSLALNKVIWHLESFDSITGTQPIIENSNITLWIDMEYMLLGGTGGCNGYGGDVVLDEVDHGMIISNVISTDIGCGDDIMEQEQRYFDTLNQVRFFTFDGATLKLVVGGDAGLNFVATE